MTPAGNNVPTYALNAPDPAVLAFGRALDSLHMYQAHLLTRDEAIDHTIAMLTESGLDGERFEALCKMTINVANGWRWLAEDPE